MVITFNISPNTIRTQFSILSATQAEKQSPHANNINRRIPKSFALSENKWISLLLVMANKSREFGPSPPCFHWNKCHRLGTNCLFWKIHVKSWIQICCRNELEVQILIEVNSCPIVWCSNFFFPLYCWPQMGLKILAKQNPFLWIYFCCMVCDHPTVIHMKSDPSRLNFNWVEINV